MRFRARALRARFSPSFTRQKTNIENYPGPLGRIHPPTLRGSSAPLFRLRRRIRPATGLALGVFLNYWWHYTTKGLLDPKRQSGNSEILDIPNLNDSI